MASKCCVRSITRTSLFSSSIKSQFSIPTKNSSSCSSFFNSSSPSSPSINRRFASISKLPVELGCGSLYPLHSVVAEARMTSRKSMVSSRSLAQATEWAKGKQIDGLLTAKNTGHFINILPQARQTISHQRVCVNVGNKNTTYFYSTSQDDKSEDDKPQNDKSQDDRKSLIDVYGEGMRRRFYVNLLLEKIISKSLPQRMWRRTKAEWYRLLKTGRGCRLLLKSRFLRDLHTSMQEEDMERTKKLGSEKVCLGSSFAEHIRIKRNLYHFKHFFLSKRRKDQNLNLPPRSKGPFVSKASIYNNSTYTSRYPFTRKPTTRRIELPTHYLEINYKTLKAVVTYGPNVSHIPSKIRHLL